MEKPRFFTDFANRGLFRGFAGLDVTLGNGPAVFRILDKEDFDVLLVFRQAKDNATGGWLTDNFLDNRFPAENGFLEFVYGGRFVLFRKCFRNF